MNASVSGPHTFRQEHSEYCVTSDMSEDAAFADIYHSLNSFSCSGNSTAVRELICIVIARTSVTQR